MRTTTGPVRTSTACSTSTATNIKVGAGLRRPARLRRDPGRNRFPCAQPRRLARRSGRLPETDGATVGISKLEAHDVSVRIMGDVATSREDHVYAGPTGSRVRPHTDVWPSHGGCSPPRRNVTGAELIARARRAGGGAMPHASSARASATCACIDRSIRHLRRRRAVAVADAELPELGRVCAATPDWCIGSASRATPALRTASATRWTTSMSLDDRRALTPSARDMSDGPTATMSMRRSRRWRRSPRARADPRS